MDDNLVFYDTQDNDKEIVIPKKLFAQVTRKSYDHGEMAGYLEGTGCTLGIFVTAYILVHVRNKISRKIRKEIPPMIAESYPVHRD